MCDGGIACIALDDRSDSRKYKRRAFNKCSKITGLRPDGTSIQASVAYVAMDFYGGGSDSDDVTLYALHNLAEAGNPDGIAALVSSSIVVSQDPSVRPPPPPPPWPGPSCPSPTIV